MNVVIPGLDLNKIGQRAEELQQMGGGDSQFVYASKLLKENRNVICFRIVVDQRFGLDGAYWLDRKDFNLNGKGILNPATIGRPDPFTSVWESAKAQATLNPNLKALTDSKDNKPGRSVLIPVVLYSPQGTMLDGKVKIMQCGVNLAKAIHASVTADPNIINGVPVMLNNAMGRACYVQKMGDGMAATYTVMPSGVDHPLAPEVLAAVFNVKEVLGKWCKDYNHLKSLLENYLYGSPIIPESKEDAPVTGMPVGAQTPQQTVYQQQPQHPANLAYQQPVPNQGQPAQQPVAPQPQFHQPQAPVQQYQQPLPTTDPNAGMPMAPQGFNAPQPPAPVPTRNVMDDLNNFQG